MNFDQFAATFQNPERDPCRDVSGVTTTQAGEVVVAGRVLTASKETCCLNINGVLYEIAASDVMDIQVLSPEVPAERADEKRDTKPADAPAKRGAEKPAAREVPPAESPRVVLIKLNGSAVMWRRTPVQATLVAAVGTWVSVVPAPTAA